MPRWMKVGLFSIPLTLVCLGILEIALRLTGFAPEGFGLARYYKGVPGDLEPHLTMVEAYAPAHKYRITITPQGTRGLKPFSPDKPEGSLRILCLGDSFTFSAGVDDKNAYPEQLATTLRQRAPDTRIDVINAGIPFFGLVDAVDYYLEKGRALHPDLVVLEIYADDFQDQVRGTVFRESQRLFSPLAKRSWLTRAFGWSRIGQWFEARHPVWTATDAVGEAMGGDLATCRSFNPELDPMRFCPTPEEVTFMTDRDKNLGQADSPAFARVRASYFKDLALFRDLLAADGVKLLALAIPDRWQVGGYRNAVNSVIASGTARLRIDTVDMVPTFRASQFQNGISPYSLNGDDHCTPYGYGLLARAVADALILSRDDQGRPRLDVRTLPPAFDYSGQSLIRMRVSKVGRLEADPPAGVRVTLERTSGQALSAGSASNADPQESPVGDKAPVEIVARVDSTGPLRRVDLLQPRGEHDDMKNLPEVRSWLSTDRDNWRPLENPESEGLAKPGSHEFYTMAEVPFDTSSPSTFWLKFRLAAGAVPLSVGGTDGKADRSLDLYLYTVQAARDGQSAQVSP